MKKTLFLSECYPPQVGGTPVMFSGRFGFYPPDKIVVLTKTAENAVTFDKSVSYPIIRIALNQKGPKGFEYLGLVWGFFKASLSIIFRNKIKIIECARPIPEGISGLLLSKLFFKKLIVNFHGEDISVLKNYRIEKIVLTFLIRSANLNLANSTYTQSLIKHTGGPYVNTKVVPPGFNPDHLSQSRSSLSQSININSKNSPVLLTIGRLQQRKGHDTVIKALPEVIKLFPDIIYVIVGSKNGGTPGYTAVLKKLSQQLGVEKHIQFAGEVDSLSLSAYYKSCDVFIMANREETGGDVEGFGIVFLEAGYFGKPVIGGNSGGVPDAIVHQTSGILVNGISVSETSQAIIQILSDREFAQKLGEGGKQQAASLTHKKVFEKYKSALSKFQI